MNKYLITLFIVCMAIYSGRGQEEVTPYLVPTFTLNFVPVGTAFLGELPVGKRSTLRAEVGGIFAFSINELSYTNLKVGVGFSPFGTVSYRYYHSFKMENKKRKYSHNSGNFIFAQILHYGSPIYANEYFSFDRRTSAGIGYGLQRTLVNRFNFSIGLGLGYYVPQKDVFFIGDLTLGILLKPN